jgi:proline iminopeptidase
MRQGLGHPAPILLLAGGCNNWTGTALQDRHARLFPNAHVATIQNAGHDVIWDQPEAALKEIRRHLAQ